MFSEKNEIRKSFNFRILEQGRLASDCFFPRSEDTVCFQFYCQIRHERVSRTKERCSSLSNLTLMRYNFTRAKATGNLLTRAKSLHDVNLHSTSLSDRRHQRTTERSRSCHSDQNDMQGWSEEPRQSLMWWWTVCLQWSDVRELDLEKKACE